MSTLIVEGQGLKRSITLNDGSKMPLFGLGFFRSEPAKSVNAAVLSLQHGYRLLDTAVYYENEREVGEGIKKSGVKREDIFVVTKIYPDEKHHGYNEAIQGVKDSLEKFGTSYIDLILIHDPLSGKLLQTYEGLLKTKEDGLVRSVGVSNFGVHHLEEMRKAGKPTPAVNQIELNCFNHQEDIVRYCRENNIAVMGYSPMFQCKKNEHPVLVKMAASYDKTVAQIMIRWSVQKDYITIPKTTTAARIAENADVFDFEISDEDIRILDSFPEDRCCFLSVGDPTEYPWVG